jgi:hypothetical protein
MSLGHAARLVTVVAGLVGAVALARPHRLNAADGAPSPEQYFGFPVGADNKIARWDKIVDYMKLVDAESDRVRVRELGRTNKNNPFLVVEIASGDTHSNIDRYKRLEQQLYFQNGAPSDRERDELFRTGKIVVAVTCSVHATELGATQMSLELVHRLATDDSPQTKKILDNVILLLVPSANPDGQITVTDWFNRNLGTPYEGSPLPELYHPYVGHDINRDMYMLTQKESRFIADLMWHDWLPSIWLDEHQMGNSGPRIFVMPAGDPINPNVHPLIYRWNAILGQSQAAALEAAGKEGIIYNATYTNFWQGALAWSGWWHNQIGLLTEVASARLASPVEQQRTTVRRGSPIIQSNRDDVETQIDSGVLPPPVDVTPRTEYPRPWAGGRWTLRDIVDYDLIATMALLETAADRRETILRQIYEINRQTVEAGKQDDVAAILIPTASQHDPREAAHLAELLDLAGVNVERATSPFEADGRQYAAGTFVVRMNQPFARYAKDLLERQNYPEVQRTANSPPDAPYDVTAWSLGMQLGVSVDFIRAPLAASVETARVSMPIQISGNVVGEGSKFGFTYAGADSAIAINRLLKSGADVQFDAPSHVSVSGVGRDRIEQLARDTGLQVTARAESSADRREASVILRAPRVGLYAPWSDASMDEGWTRWVLERYEFNATILRNQDVRSGSLRKHFDAIILSDQNPREIIDGYDMANIRPEYRGGIGEAGLASLRRFIGDGGTLIAFGAATDLAIDRLQVPIRNVKRSLRREQHYAPGTILRIEVNTTHPLGYGMAPHTFGFYNNNPFFATVDASSDPRASIIAQYPTENVVASGWLKGEENIAGRAAVVSIDLNPGRIVLFGLRPQHRAQTHATFPMLFNALFLSAQ